jgi:hypothetical protein
MEDAGELQVRYKFHLSEVKSGKTIEIVNCLRRDLSRPNFYWDEESKFIVVEICSDSFKASEIKVINLKSFETDLLARGLIGNTDSSQAVRSGK